MPTTRSFLLEQAGVKKFWDITWDGPNVEVTSGTWGTNGRARDKTFASPAERDAYIAAQIAKVQKQGYIEIDEVAPTSDFATQDHAKKAAAVRAKVDQLLRPAWLPTFGPGDGVGRVRAPMTLEPNEPWPMCPCCDRAMSGAFELDMTQLPAIHLRREGVAQLFWCEAWEVTVATCARHRADGSRAGTQRARIAWLGRAHRRPRSQSSIGSVSMSCHATRRRR